MYEGRKNGETETKSAIIGKKAVCYVDGSFNPEINKYAYGCVLVNEDGTYEGFNGSGNDPEALLQRNVAGEMIASMISVKLAITRGYTNLEIFYDYSGIECWVTGAWKAKNVLTRKYRDWMRSQMSKIDISFKKVTAHSNNKYNDMADNLAKEGLLKEPGVPEIK